jgi:nucleoside-diphosphate-sugar epimerase
LGRSGAIQKEITEDEEWGESGYNSAYGISKYMAETEVWRGIGEGLNAVIMNPGIILGEGDFNEGSAELMKVAFSEFPFYTKGCNGWADVKDVANLLQALMDSDLEAERYIVSSGNYTYQQIFTLMAQALGKKPPHIYANSFITSLIWRWGKLQSLFGKRPLITKETATNAHSISQYSNKKLLAALPSFTYTSIEETIQRMAKAYLNAYNIK